MPDETKAAAAARYTRDFMFRIGVETKIEDKLAYIYRKPGNLFNLTAARRLPRVQTVIASRE